MIQGQEIHSIIKNIFEDVRGYLHSEQIQVNCPICQEKEGLSHPDGKFNLEINTSKRMFRCWKCDEPKFSGSLARLIRKFGSNADYEIYKSYADIFGSEEYSVEIDEESIKIELPYEMIPFSKYEIGNSQHFEAYNYLVNERKISKEIILKYRIGFCLSGRYAKRIIIPSYDKNGHINYFVARSYDKSNKKFPYDNPKSNKNLVIFNEGYLNWDSTIFLVEGVFEMFSLPTNAIPLLGKVLSTKLFLTLKEKKPNIIIILDPDAYSNSIELYYQLYSIYVGCEERVKIVKLPFEKDLDLIRVKRGNDSVISCLYNARYLNVDDYFVKKLTNPYEYRGTGRHNSNSKNFDWKGSGNTKNFI